MKTIRTLIQICLLGAALLTAHTGRAQSVTKVAAGALHTLFVKSDGSLWGMGDNEYGQLGDGTTSNVYFPEKIPLNGSGSVTTIAAGGGHSLFIKKRGANITELWAMGDNAEGQLGDGTTNNRQTSVKILSYTFPQAGSPVTAIAAGTRHSLFLKGDGSLWAMGNNAFGQLGDGTTNNRDAPVKIESANVTAISAGGAQSLFIMSDGSLWGMGYNSDGELGTGNYNNALTPVIIEQDFSITSVSVTAIAAGGEHSLFINSNGSLWGMGDDQSSQLGSSSFDKTNIPEEMVASNVTVIAAGGEHTLFITGDGSLWATGEDLSGQLGDGSYYERSPFIEDIVNSFYYGPVTAVAGGENHTVFIRGDGSLWGMGANGFGQLGIKTYTGDDTTNRPAQIVAAPGHNTVSVQLLSGGNVQLSFVGFAEQYYALDRTFNLASANWVPQITNTANGEGSLVFTNTPNPATNNFWRFRYVGYEY